MKQPFQSMNDPGVSCDVKNSVPEAGHTQQRNHKVEGFLADIEKNIIDDTDITGHQTVENRDQHDEQPDDIHENRPPPLTFLLAKLYTFTSSFF